jgi:hypothetical protein
MSSLPPPPFDPPPPPAGDDQPWQPTQPMPATPPPPAAPPTNYPPASHPPAGPPAGYPPTTQMPTQPGGYPPGQYPPGPAGPPPGYGGQPYPGQGYGTPPPPVTPAKKKTGLFVGLGVVAALAAGGGIYAATSGGDDTAEPADTEVTEVPETDPVTTDAADPTTTFAPITLPPATIPPETTEPAVEPGTVDLGGGIIFTAPDGYTAEGGPNGEYNLTNGASNMFIQVLQRDPGEDVMVLMQEYIDSFDTNFDTVGYSQTVPYADSSTTPATDGIFVFYRALNADGSGFDGAIDVNRRADGLIMIADRFITLDDTTVERFPDDLYDEIFASFYAVPSQGAEAELTTPVPVRVNTIHAPNLIDGLVGLTPPPGWVVDNPGPGRVVFSSTTGQRWTAGRLTDTTDVAAAQAEAQAELLAVIPDAAFDPPEDVPSGDYLTQDVTWTGTAPDGGRLNGVISVWVHPANGDAWAGGYSFREDSSPGDPFFEYDFLLRVFDQSIINLR